MRTAPELSSSARHAVYTVHTSLLFDSETRSFLTDISLDVNPKSGNITSVYKRDALSQISPEDIDLRGLTVIPGLVDAHTHIFLHSYAETSSVHQMRDESLVERILRSSNHLKAALRAGCTTYRDLGTEGLRDLDVGVRNAVNRGIVPGPRLFVATEPLASSGGYEVRIESRDQGTVTTRISDPCDGEGGVRAGVRRRLGAGADVIKFYGDYRKRNLRFPDTEWPGCLPIQHAPNSGPGGIDTSNDPLTVRSPASPLFTFDEMKAMVDEAKRARCPIAAHTTNPETVVEAANAGVTSIEHGYIPSKEAIKAMKDNDTIFVPTLAIIQQEGSDELVEAAMKQLRDAWESGVRLACGGDTGAFNHGENLRELLLFERAGVSLEDTLRAATLGGWEACGGDWSGRRFGHLKEGWAADLIAIEGDPRKDGIKSLKNVEWVLKDGQVVVDHGKLIV